MSDHHSFPIDESDHPVPERSPIQRFLDHLRAHHVALATILAAVIAVASLCVYIAG